ncbi:threonine transporter RhtB [Cellulomonas denverensis]|nr:threonine transporter RhtB [Cellulomonas denverensis]
MLGGEMEQFLAVAAAHFLALLIPGVDFFLIARTSLAHGWRNATGACLGIAAANALFITAAFCGVSLISHPLVLGIVQAAGGGFLMVIGVAFLRSSPVADLGRAEGVQAATWRSSAGLGLASGLLNPKNALFYLSLAAVVGTVAPLTRVLYGAWMVGVVLLWDVLVAVALGSRRALARWGRVLPWLTRIAGVFLVLFGGAMLVTLVVQHRG